MLDPALVADLSPYEMIEVTYRIVHKRCLEVERLLQEGTLEEQLLAAGSLQGLAEWEFDLQWCLALPETWNPVGSCMKDAVAEIDPVAWTQFVRQILREVVTFRHPDDLVH